VHFAHRVGALVVTGAVAATVGHVWFHHRRHRGLSRPATLLAALVLVQVTLGALTILTRRDVAINSAHVVCGALVLATSLTLTLRSWREKFERSARVQPDQVPVRLTPDATPAVDMHGGRA
jgi:cytochrome c oxidase assembly protein subunit 15